jgi:hypothetical protein
LLSRTWRRYAGIIWHWNRKGIPGCIAVTMKLATAINVLIEPLVCVKRNLVG